MIIKNKKRAFIIILMLIILMIIGIGIRTYINIKNNYFLKIGNAFYKLLKANSTEFEFQYINNDDRISVNGSIEYNFNELEFFAKAYSGDKKIVLDVSREISTLKYYLQTFEKWVTIDITDISSEILEILENFGEGSIEESFPVQEILSVAEIDEKIDISKYPNKLSKRYDLKFIDKNFSKNVLNYISFIADKKGNSIVYSINPNIYELLDEFLKTSDLKLTDKKELRKELEAHKKELENIDIILSVIINEEGYVESLSYKRIENNDIKSINLDFNNINNVKNIN